MNRILIAALLTALSTPALAWEVPVHESTFNPGPHPAGETIPCDYTNEDGQTFSGTIHTNSSGNLVCGGMVVNDSDTEVLAAQLDLQTFEPSDCEAWAEGDEVIIECPTEEPVVQQSLEPAKSR